MSRQVILTTEMAFAPSTWNSHIAPLFLRCMVEAYITMAWILEDPKSRSKQYVEYGIGQEKLYIEFLEESISKCTDPSDLDMLERTIQGKKSWLNSQLAEWATEVNVGSWSGMSAREMAKEIGRESTYKYAYVPLSGAVHNMWQHVGMHNVRPCTNPLHKGHLVPIVRYNPFMEADYMRLSSKYMTMTFVLFDEKMGIKCNIQLPEDFFFEHELFSPNKDLPTK